jgi:hypothetical protein
MDIFKKFTVNELVRVFAVCALPGHLWSFVNILEDVPSLLLSMRVWDVIGTAAYVLVFVFLESLAVFLFVYVIGLLVPRQFVEKRLAIFAGFFMMYAVLFSFLLFLIPTAINAMHWWLLGFSVVCTLWLILCKAMLDRGPDLERKISGFIDRLVLLMGFYVSLDFIALVLVIVRNT